ncbi:flagellar basal body rod protein FlgC [Desulfovulcanus sp.]
MMDIAVSQNALNVFSLAQDITANNVANINTDEYRAKRLDIETGPDGQGVQAQAIVESSDPGPLTDEMQTVKNDDGSYSQENVLIESSNTEPAREIIQMIENERSFEANAQVVKTYDQMAGRIIDMLV